jgi:archaellum biogenesis protein FlaJ (TadC family)
MITKYSEFCHEQVGSYSDKYVDYFEGLAPVLKRSDIDITLRNYVSVILFTVLMISGFVFTFMSVITILTMGFSGLFLSLTVAIASATLSLIGLYLYPSYRRKQAAESINDNLPFAVMYLSTLAGTGASLSELFSSLAEEDHYGKISDEAQKIHTDIEVLGLDPSEALRNAATRSPSEELEDIFWEMNHIILTGGTLRDFLTERADAQMEKYLRRVEEFSQKLGLYVQMYIILVIVGSIIFTAMGVVMGTIAGVQANIIVLVQVAALFFGLPLISAFFIVMIESIMPGGVE